jgi:hypothetical protein
MMTPRISLFAEHEREDRRTKIGDPRHLPPNIFVVADHSATGRLYLALTAV